MKLGLLSLCIGILALCAAPMQAQEQSGNPRTQEIADLPPLHLELLNFDYERADAKALAEHAKALGKQVQELTNYIHAKKASQDPILMAYVQQAQALQSVYDKRKEQTLAALKKKQSEGERAQVFQKLKSQVQALADSHQSQKPSGKSEWGSSPRAYEYKDDFLQTEPKPKPTVPPQNAKTASYTGKSQDAAPPAPPKRTYESKDDFQR